MGTEARAATVRGVHVGKRLGSHRRQTPTPKADAEWRSLPVAPAPHLHGAVHPSASASESESEYSRAAGPTFQVLDVAIEAIQVLAPVVAQIQRRDRDLAEVYTALAALGGHLRSNGPSGWIVLGRVLEKLLVLERGCVAGRRRSDR